MKFICYTEWNQLPESANILFSQEEKESIFSSRSWFKNLTTLALDDDHTMVLACVVSGNKVFAILPLMKCAGNIGYSLKHRYTSLYSLLLIDHEQLEQRQQVLTCLTQGLSQLPINAFLLEPVDNNDSKLNDFKYALESTGFSCEYIFRHYNWVYRVQGQAFKDYMASRPSQLRNTILRKERKLEREYGYDIRLFTGDNVSQKMSDYYAVYNSSWKATEQYVDFLNGIVDVFSQKDWSRLAVLYVKDQPIAAQLWFVSHSKANIFRLSYDEAWKKYSPGSILTRFLMEYVIDIDKVEEIDFLTGNDTYKQDWMSDRRERFVLSCIKTEDKKSIFKSFFELVKRKLSFLV